jgi:hypothetical protein
MQKFNESFESFDSELDNENDSSIESLCSLIDGLFINCKKTDRELDFDKSVVSNDSIFSDSKNKYRNKKSKKSENIKSILKKKIRLISIYKKIVYKQNLKISKLKQENYIVTTSNQNQSKAIHFFRFLIFFLFFLFIAPIKIFE